MGISPGSFRLTLNEEIAMNEHTTPPAVEKHGTGITCKGRDLINSCFYTCKTGAEANEFIERFNDAHVTTAFMVGLNTAYYRFRNVEIPK